MNKQAIEIAEDLLSFIDNSPVSYFAVKNITNKLDNEGYQALDEGQKWSLTLGEKYYVKRNESAVIAFQLGSQMPWESGFNIAGAHTDSPHLKLKNESLEQVAGCLKASIETYGGGINSTWLDRDLSLAGRISVKVNGKVENRLVDFKTAIGVVPNLAIHLNRQINEGVEYNKQKHLPVIFATSDADVNTETFLKEKVAKQAGIEVADLLEMDLFFYDMQKGSLIGFNHNLLSVGRIDNLAMCHAIYRSLLTANAPIATNIGAFFDSEEIGSRTLMGADSNYLDSLLDRIVFSLGGTLEDSLRARHHSFLISTDGAHALHANFTDKHDKAYAPLLNKGPVIKISSNFKYATTAETSGLFIELCEKAGVPYQKMANRSDLLSGGTIGALSSAALGIKTIDVGSPMLAMHSIRETQGVLDHFYMIEVLKAFYKG